MRFTAGGVKLLFTRTNLPCRQECSNPVARSWTVGICQSAPAVHLPSLKWSKSPRPCSKDDAGPFYAEDTCTGADEVQGELQVLRKGVTHKLVLAPLLFSFYVNSPS